MEALLNPAVLAGLGALALALLTFGGLFWRKRRGAPSKEAMAPDWVPEGALVDGHRPPDPAALASQFLALARQASDAEGIVVLLPSGGGWKVALCSPGLKAAPSVPRREGLPALALDGERELTAETVHAQSLGYLPDREGSVSLALLPLTHRGKVRGLLCCHRAAGKSFGEREMAILRRCARVLDGWETFAAHHAALSACRDQEERLARGLERMLSEQDPEEIAGLALDALFDLLPAIYGFVAVQSSMARFSRLLTKRFQAPEHLQYLQKNTWAHWVQTRGREPLYVEGATSRETAMPILYKGEPFPAGAVAYLQPLEMNGELFGVVGIVGKPEEEFSEENRLAASRFLKQVSALMTLALVNLMNEENSMKDSLTGLYNRRHFEERLLEELKRGQRQGSPVSLLILDIDHFKAVNDTYGHPAGDATLREVAQRLQMCFREIDVLCRYGGEEFAAILPLCPQEEAVMVAERVRSAIEGLPSGGEGVLPCPVTVSIGVASFPHPSTTPTGLQRAADEALYEAKRRGRNRVEAARR